MRKFVTLYTTRHCPYCIRARGFLEDRGIEYEDIAVDHDPRLREEMTRRSGRYTVPQIWIGDQHVGGCDDLMLLAREGRLDTLLAQAQAAS